MNQINRFEKTWTPEWDLGLQDSFEFMNTQTSEREHCGKARSGWSFASAEVLNRQSASTRRMDSGANSLGALISYFETQCAEEGGADHE